jgi:8-oxo-dGTP pyrophosphatase MutT (NUDIX family)
MEPQAAATVMIARESAGGIEVFMLRRSSRSAFMPDVFVFPGGRVEAQDGAAVARGLLAAAAPGVDPAWVFAAARETFEECGLLFAERVAEAAALAAARARVAAGELTFAALLGEFGTRVDAGALHYFSRWVTPPLEARRFDTHFFVARAPAGQAACADARETHDGIWIAPREALARRAAGSFALIFPTIKHLERIAAFASPDALLRYSAQKAVRTVMPEIDAQRALIIPPALEGVW